MKNTDLSKKIKELRTKMGLSQGVVALIPKTTYYFRIVAESGNGLSMGNILSFVAQPTSTGANGLVIPNIFTPNNDGVNDTWDLSSLTLSSNSVVNIYNRYGMLIYASVGYSTPWDGTYKRMNVPMGTYYYFIDFKNGTTPIAGPVTIIR